MKMVGAPFSEVHFSAEIALMVERVSGIMCGKIVRLPFTIDEMRPHVKPNFENFKN